MNEIEEVKRLVCAPKYLEAGESFYEGMSRIADNLKDNEQHFQTIQEILINRRFLPAGRIQASAGAARRTTAFNCFASGIIEDNSDSIMQELRNAFQTMRLGGGDGFDFSNLRPKGSLIKSLGSGSSGPIGFMKMWDGMCQTVKSAGHRRGAMMGTLRIDHPDIEEFITCKQVPGVLTNFNISVLVTDEFMKALENDEDFELKFEGVVHKVVSAKGLWNKIMRNTWSHAEPGVLFIDRINRKNNLHYCETIYTTNPCGEQPLPPHGACLLGSFNLTQYCEIDSDAFHTDKPWADGLPMFNMKKFVEDIPPIIRMMDNVIDRTIYPLAQQEREAKSKRRMGIGITGLANTLEFLGYVYGSDDAVKFTESVMTVLRDYAYSTSISLSIEKGSFPMFNKEEYLKGEFIKTLPENIQEAIERHGIRNSHLLSIAPTGTISLWADNISSGIEPVFAHEYDRVVYMPDGSQRTFSIMDYAYDKWGLRGVTSGEISAEDHIRILCAASRLVDSSCSKTCNVGDNVTFKEFKNLYIMAYNGGASGCTTFRPKALQEKFAEGRGAVLKLKEVPNPESAGMCEINPITGERTCAD